MTQPSFEKVHYRLRPAKNVQRKMLCEAFRRLSKFGSISSYRYVGMGSPYFSDFEQFHKSLGIQNMICIEDKVDAQERFEFNRPYNCIQLLWGDVIDVLPQLDWRARSIIWLDYDDKLTFDVLAALRFLLTNSRDGNVIVFTVDAKPDEYGSDRLAMLKKRVGEDKVPRDISTKDLESWGLAEVSARILKNEISDILSELNGLRQSGSKLLFKQLFNFQYSDGTPMLTIGGLLYEEGQTRILDSCSFGDFSFISIEGNPYRIEVPYLTYREIRYLNSRLPKGSIATKDYRGIPSDFVARYRKIYRYFPAFVEAEI